MNLRDYLELREKQLSEGIGTIRRQTIPVEAELEEIRRAISALNPASDLQPSELRRYLTGRERDLRGLVKEWEANEAKIQAEIAEVQQVRAAIELNAKQQLNGGDVFGQPSANCERPSEAVRIPYESLTIKELVLTALREHFPKGATIGQLIDFFREKWGRDIDRPSLSPQLSRLFAAGQITQFGNRREWHILPEGPPGAVGLHPFLTQEGVMWKFPAQASRDDLAAKVRETSRPDFDDPEDRRGKKRYRRHTYQMSCGQIVARDYRTVWLSPNEVGPNDELAPDDEPTH